jgi:hypothetical protein
MSDEPLAYLVALRRQMRWWRYKRWLKPHRVALWAIRKRWPSPQTTINVPWFGGETIAVTGSRGYYAERRDFAAAIHHRDLRLFGAVLICWLRGHDMPMQFCTRCAAFIP